MRVYATEPNPGSLTEKSDTSQPVISGIITKFTPFIETSAEEDGPTADKAKKAAPASRLVLVDGFLAPIRSWRDTPELWSGTHKTTEFNGQTIVNLAASAPSRPAGFAGTRLQTVG